MLLSSAPTKFNIPWAANAGVGYITQPIPQTTVAPGRASLDQGFPTTTFEPEASGGNPPFGADMNGILYQATQTLRWMEAGGWFGYDAAFQTAISGYPNRALIQSATAGHYWISTADNNASDPDTGGANWIAFPDLLIQQQAGNFTATDSGAVNAAKVTLSPLPVSWAAMVGAPIRFLIANTNTTTAVTLELIGASGSLGTKVLKNTDGTAMDVGQLTAAGLVEGFYDGTVVQVASPGHVIPGGSSVLPPGAIVLCPIETPFSGTLPCEGGSYLRASFPRLFNVIGTIYGAADGNHFNLPDMRGIFVRGWDHGRGLDPNAGTRAAPGVLAPPTTGATGPAGDHVGTTETWANGPMSTSLLNPVVNWANGYINIGLAGMFSGQWNSGSLPLAVDLSMIGWTSFSGSGVTPNFATSSTGYVAPPDPPSVPGGSNPWQQNSVAPFLLPYNLVSGSSSNWNGVVASSISGTLIGTATETRPVNLSLMYVIAY